MTSSSHLHYEPAMSSNDATIRAETPYDTTSPARGLTTSLTTSHDVQRTVTSDVEDRHIREVYGHTERHLKPSSSHDSSHEAFSSCREGFPSSHEASSHQLPIREGSSHVALNHPSGSNLKHREDTASLRSIAVNDESSQQVSNEAFGDRMDSTMVPEDAQSSNVEAEACLHPYLLRFCCPECSIGFGTELELTNHINQLHTGEKPSRCSKCNRFFTNLAESLLHEVSRHRRQFYTCGRCLVLFDVAATTSEQSETPPQDLANNVLKYSCKECYLGFSCEADLTGHMNQVHTDEKPCKCSTCDKCFTSLNELEIHALSHQRMFHTCYECDETFNDAMAYNRHKKRKHAEESVKALPKECEECGKCFHSAAHLLRHLSVHTDDKPYVCDGCEASFKEKGMLRKHKRLAHGSAKSEERNRCEQCGKRFPHASQLKRHMMRHSDEKPHECEHCGRMFKDVSYLNKHLRRYHMEKEEKNFQCPQCSKLYPTAANLKRHLRIHTGEKPYKCDHCEKSFSDQSNLSAHKKRGRCGKGGQSRPPSPVDKPFSCETCGKSFSQHNNLVRHERTHSGEKPYKCEHCDRQFGDRSYLIKHCRQEHGVEMSSRIGRSGMSSRQSSENQDTASEADTSTPLARSDKAHVCEDCGKSFLMASQLKRHVLTHGQKTIQCNECGKFLTSLGNLKAHKRVHTGEKPYQCESCGNRFARLSTLVYHRRTHTGEKPHQCDVCGRGFSVSSALIKHKRSIHIGEKPYQCNHCGKFFSRTSNLKKHLRTHTGERPHQCEQCGRRFRERNHLTTHIKLIHNGEKARSGQAKASEESHRPHQGLTSPNSAAESLLALSRDDPIAASLFVPRRDDPHYSRQYGRDPMTSHLLHRRHEPPPHLERRDDMTSMQHVAERRDDAAAFFSQRRDDPMTAASLLAQRRPESMMYPDIPLMLMKDVGYS